MQLIRLNRVDTIADVFQSSTRQTDLQHRLAYRKEPTRPRGFNPLRGRQTLQHAPGVPDGQDGVGVSILYEADRLCNAG